MKKQKIYSPFEGKLIGTFEYTTSKDIKNILDSLKSGVKTQKNISYHQRAEILLNLSKLLEDNSEKLAKLITIETGKTITDSRAELKRSANTAFIASIEARNVKGEAINSNLFNSNPNKTAIIRREAIGTILCITPFNFPINLALHKIAPAFAMGNTILLKPHPQNYRSAKLLVDLCHQAGMSKDVIQFFYPKIKDLNGVIKGNQIQCISFTGGEVTADKIARNAGRKKLLLELGGNDPLIVMPDGDVKKAAIEVINSRFGNAGQKCTSSKRVFIHEKVYEKFKKTLLDSSKGIKVGDPMLDDTFCGPVISEHSANEIIERIESAIKDGARLLLGGKKDGNVIHPTILENVNLESDLIAKETFGPVVPLIKFKDIDELISMVNSSNYGLQAGVFTNNLEVIQKLYSELEVGSLAVNEGPSYRAEHLPFGGVKDSGIGREGIRYAMEEMSVLKNLIL